MYCGNYNNKLYSSFSQTKGLLWYEWFDGILNNNFLPPVGAVLDLTNDCNLLCDWCNAKVYRSGEKVSFDQAKKVIDMTAEWGVKSLCYAGGGEPSLHEKFGDIVEYTADRGLEVGISTNGVLLDKRTLQIIANKARFCGFSIDAGSEDTWSEIKNSDQWNKLIDNIRYISKEVENTILDLTYKFMITDYNQYEIYDACKLAKELGFKSFFTRPAAFENVKGLEKQDMNYDVNAIKDQLNNCENLETDIFRVYYSFGRVNEKLKRKIGFDKCRVTPIMAIFCADGYCYPCIDMRGRKEYRMCKHLDLVKYWNSEKHKRLIDDIDTKNCPRCAMGHYNQQICAYAKDYMFRWFP